MRRAAGLLLMLALFIPAAVMGTTRRVVGRKPVRGELVRIAESHKAPLQSLVAAEQEFAKLSGSKGIRAAFLASLSRDCVMFRPLPVNGYDMYEARPANTAKLAWAPSYAEVSAAGDFGMTCGPWEWTPPIEKENPETAYGTFLSVWRREPGKPWKNVLDGGISHDSPGTSLRATIVETGPDHTPFEPVQGAEDTLLAQDRALSDMAQEYNTPRAIVARTTDDLRFLSEGQPPYQGDVARNALSLAARNATWNPLGSAVSRSQDMAYTYGVRVRAGADSAAAPDSVVYVHVWRKMAGEPWKIFAAVDHGVKR